MSNDSPSYRVFEADSLTPSTAQTWRFGVIGERTCLELCVHRAMLVLDPGHRYSLACLDGAEELDLAARHYDIELLLYIGERTGTREQRYGDTALFDDAFLARTRLSALDSPRSAYGFFVTYGDRNQPKQSEMFWTQLEQVWLEQTRGLIP